MTPPASIPATPLPALAPPRWRSVLRSRAVLAVLLGEVLVAALVAWGLWALHRQTLEGELRTLGSLSAAMAAEADGTLDVADAVLRATRTELADGLLQADTDAARALLQARVATLPRFRALTVFDAQGRRGATSRDGDEPALALAPRPYVATLRAAAASGAPPALVLDTPPADPAGGPPGVTIAMDWRDAQGVFQGVVVLEAEPDFLDGGFERIAPTPDTRLAVYRGDGALAPGRPGAQAPHRLPASAVAALWAAAADGRPRLMGWPDGHRQLVAAHRLQRLPLLLVLTRDAQQALADWTEQAWIVGAFTASALAMTLWLTLRNVRDQALRRAEQQRLQEQLQRARKLEALGTLAGGVAHDFNNILAAVIGYGELARDAAPPASAQARQLDQVLQAGLRGKALVARILSFSRGAPRPHAVLRLQPVVDEVLQLLATALPAQVQLLPRLEAPDAAITGDATLVFEATMNLCTNAMQALQDRPGGGRIVVALAVVQPAQPLALYDRTLAPGRYACLSVSDDGPGIAPEVRPRLFEPFFTTKGPQHGTGLGLAVVHGAVQAMGGAIEVDSAPGRGTRMALYFPCVAVGPDHGLADEAPLPLGQGQTVLVVDDEEALVALAQELLAELGYEPFGLASSAQALAEFQAEPQRFDLVLTDERMPELTGTQLAGALRALRPDLPVVLVSGDGGPQLDARAAAAGVSMVLRKPLQRAELAQALARALGRRR